MSKELLGETLLELTDLQRKLDFMIGLLEDEDIDGDEFQRIFESKFYSGTDYTITCSKAKGLIGAMKENL